MKTIKIISGTYGYHPQGAKHTKAIPRGETCTVENAEAERLINLGIAELAVT